MRAVLIRGPKAACSNRILGKIADRILAAFSRVLEKTALDSRQRKRAKITFSRILEESALDSAQRISAIADFRSTRLVEHANPGSVLWDVGNLCFFLGVSCLRQWATVEKAFLSYGLPCISRQANVASEKQE